MTLDARMRATAKSLIAKFGKQVTFTSVTDTTYDPTTSTAAPTSTSYTVNAIVEDFGSVSNNASSFNSDQMIRSYDKQITVAAADLPVVPGAKDKVSFDTFNMTVVRVLTIYSGALAASYVIHCTE